MHYTLNQLQVFLKVVQTGSVTKASEELHLTQPAVSIQLRNFQEQFDYYFWRAEKQANGNIHFHLLVDRFIPMDLLRK